MTESIQPSESITPQFFAGVPDITGDESDSTLPLGIYDFSNMCIEAVYIIDFLKRGFHFVGCHDLFLCGHTVTEAMDYDEYMPCKDKWVRHKIKPLSDWEKDVLQLAKQGLLLFFFFQKNVLLCVFYFFQILSWKSKKFYLKS